MRNARPGDPTEVIMFKKLWKESSGLAWTLGGTGLVLITLSGSTRDLGIVISVVSLLFHMAGVITPDDDE